MGKLVLGIIAVTFLQIVFFVYVAIYGPTDKAVLPVRMDRAAIARPIEQEILPDVAEPLTARPADPAPSRVARVTVGHSPSKRNIKRPVIERLRKSVPPEPHSDRTNAPIAFARPEPFRAIAKNMVAKRYEVVVTDYPRKYPEKRFGDQPRHRKRPFLARALPALVKKPWGWMKSFASKLK